MKQGYTKFGKDRIALRKKDVPRHDSTAAEVAHSIQNPLQFVNNYAALNIELLVELQNALTAGNKAEAEAIIHDVMLNCHRIEQHGKRVSQAVAQMQLRCK